MNRRPLVLSTVVALTAAVVVPAAGAAAAPQPADRVSALTSTYRSYGRPASHTPPTAPIAATLLPGSADALRLTTTATGSTVRSLDVRAPEAAPRLAVGSHAVGATASTVQLSLTADDGCTATSGELDVLAVEHDDAGRLTSLAADYVVGCTDGRQRSGSVRWNSAVPYAVTTTPGKVAPTPQPPGRTVQASIVLTNAGTASQTYGPSSFPRVEELDAPHSITQDGCDGVTLAPGGTCRIDLAFDPEPLRGGFLAHLETPDGSPGGTAYTWVQLDWWELPQPTFTATPVRGGVRLTTTSEAATFDVMRDSTLVAGDVTLPWTDPSAVAGADHEYRIGANWDNQTLWSARTVTRGALPVPRGAEGEFVALPPTRVLDTRTGTGARAGAVGPSTSVRFDPLAGTQVPRDAVLAVLLNVTGTEASTPTHVRAWPSGTELPTTSSLNLVPGRSRPNQVILPLGENDRVSLFNDSGTTHLLADVQGYFVSSSSTSTDGGGYHPIDPVRALDTRTARGTGPAAALRADEVVWVPLTLPDGTGTVSAVDVNLTVTEPGTEGHLIAWSGAGDAPGVSNANFVAGQTIANHSTVPVSYRAGRPGIAVRNVARGTTHVIVDVQGWYDDGSRADGLRFRPVTTTRIHDSRDGVGRPPVDWEIPVTARPDAVAHVVNITATQGVGPGHVIAWGGGDPRPSTSVLNYAPGEDAPNLAVVTSPLSRQLGVTTMTSYAHVVVDHLGYYY
ncbi:hypothetical protein J1G42_03290 [Cellulomonas sp. zg-ZUI222]|uniref:hypothetical protein n=1 Tax=Cellulomonas wangleii TaxID=2816956 RepID=UPI001A941508|nr:hypothetical protein [Cellulomonas wangleii]MBO0919850.1 hypothetical protein [Cellulomonas wangleii]